MKILLTGCHGQVGREIQRTLANQNIDLIALTRENFDISDPNAGQQIITQYSPQFIINAAAYTAVDKAEMEATNAFAINAKGPLFLATACEKADIPLIHLSTDYIFNGEKKLPYEENDTASPLNIYGQSKWEGEEAIRRHLKKHIILRTSWVFGTFGHNFVKTMMNLAQQRDRLNIVADQLGCPTSASSIGKVIWKIIDSLNANLDNPMIWGTYHYSNYPTASWYDFANNIISIGASLKDIRTKINPISSDQYPTLAKRPMYSVLNCEKIHSAFGIKPAHWKSELLNVMNEIYLT